MNDDIRHTTPPDPKPEAKLPSVATQLSPIRTIANARLASRVADSIAAYPEARHKLQLSRRDYAYKLILSALEVVEGGRR